MSKELRAARSYLAQQNRRYPAHLVNVPQEEWPTMPLSRWGNQAARRLAVLRSRDFLVQVTEEQGHVRLSVNRTKIKSNGAWEDGITWDELQRIKREAGFGALAAVEVYPADQDLVDVANMRHVWLCDATLEQIVPMWKRQEGDGLKARRREGRMEACATAGSEACATKGMANE